MLLLFKKNKKKQMEDVSICIDVSVILMYDLPSLLELFSQPVQDSFYT